MGISSYAKLIFKQMYRLQERPMARYIRERTSGSPLNPNQTVRLIDIQIPVLYSETQSIATDLGSVIPITQMFFYIRKSDLPQDTKPVIGDKIIYKDKTYIVKRVSEIANVIYRIHVDDV